MPHCDFSTKQKEKRPGVSAGPRTITVYISGTKDQDRDLYIATYGDAGNSFSRTLFLSSQGMWTVDRLKQLTADITPHGHVTVKYK